MFTIFYSQRGRMWNSPSVNANANSSFLKLEVLAGSVNFWRPLKSWVADFDAFVKFKWNFEQPTKTNHGRY